MGNAAPGEDVMELLRLLRLSGYAAPQLRPQSRLQASSGAAISRATGRQVTIQEVCSHHCLPLKCLP